MDWIYQLVRGLAEALCKVLTGLARRDTPVENSGGDPARRERVVDVVRERLRVARDPGVPNQGRDDAGGAGEGPRDRP